MADESNNKDKSLSFDKSDDTTGQAPSASEESNNTIGQTKKTPSALEESDNTTNQAPKVPSALENSDNTTGQTKKAPENSDNNTFSFDDARPPKTDNKTGSTPSGDTAVFSQDDRRLKRILNSHQSDENDGTMALGQTQEVILLVRGMVERVMMQSGISYKLGRFELGINEADEVDLTPYGAQDRGVSRVHAQLQIIDAVVNITDLGSTNGTFVNGNRLEKNTPTVLRKGDELLLGRLTVQVLFRQS